MAKMDWSDAYKHIHVWAADMPLQYFSWLGRYFAEKCLVFGAVSSAGLYDRVAKFVLWCVIILAVFAAYMVCQYLDDVCAAAPAGEAGQQRLQRF